jgi:hypothetical protein
MSNKLIKVSQEMAKTLRRWDPSSLGPYSKERKQGPKYFTSVPGDDGWDTISYYID